MAEHWQKMCGYAVAEQAEALLRQATQALRAAERAKNPVATEAAEVAVDRAEEALFKAERADCSGSLQELVESAFHLGIAVGGGEPPWLRTR